MASNQIMGASFQDTEQILALTGCDLLTISPTLLAELEEMEGHISLNLDSELAQSMEMEKYTLVEKNMRWMHNEDPMAVEKLAEGIRNFTKDLRRLEEYVRQKLSQE